MGQVRSGDLQTVPKWSAMFPGGYGTNFDQKFLQKTWTNQDFPNFLLLDFAIFPPGPFYIDFTFQYFFWFILHLFCNVFPKFSWFFELQRLRDQSQIVDLKFRIRMVSTRASKTSKTPHSWQNNVPIPTLFSASFLITGVW